MVLPIAAPASERATLSPKLKQLTTKRMAMMRYLTRLCSASGNVEISVLLRVFVL